jgi:hypothetical protein
VPVFRREFFSLPGEGLPAPRIPRGSVPAASRFPPREGGGRGGGGKTPGRSDISTFGDIMAYFLVFRISFMLLSPHDAAVIRQTRPRGSKITSKRGLPTAPAPSKNRPGNEFYFLSPMICGILWCRFKMTFDARRPRLDQRMSFRARKPGGRKGMTPFSPRGRPKTGPVALFEGGVRDLSDARVSPRAGPASKPPPEAFSKKPSPNPGRGSRGAARTLLFRGSRFCAIFTPDRPRRPAATGPPGDPRAPGRHSHPTSSNMRTPRPGDARPRLQSDPGPPSRHPAGC